MIGGLRISFQDAWGESAGFGPENEKKPQWWRHWPERLLSGFWQQHHFILAGRQFGLQIVKIIPDAEFHLLPVVQTRPFYFFAVQRKSQRPDEMQKGSGGHAGAADIAGVPVDFRRYKHHVTFQIVAANICQSLSQSYVSKVGEIVAP